MVIPGATTGHLHSSWRRQQGDEGNRNEDDNGYYLRATATYTDITTVMDDIDDSPGTTSARRIQKTEVPRRLRLRYLKRTCAIQMMQYRY